MADFLKKALVRTFPLWLGQDTTFTVNRVDSQGDPLDYDDGTELKVVFFDLDIDDIESDAVISGSAATFTIKYTDVVDVPTGGPWRMEVSVNGIDKAPVIGKVVRTDGT